MVLFHVPYIPLFIFIMEYFKTDSWILCRTYMFKLSHFIVIQYEIQLCLIITYYRTFTLRKSLARKIFKCLELSPAFKDNLIIIEISYSNAEILEFFILVFMSVTIKFCQTFFYSILFNPNSITVTPIVVFDSISKPLKHSICIFLPLVELTMKFSRAKRILLFISEIVFNYIFFIALKFEKETLAFQIETTKEYFLNFLKSINYTKLFYYVLRLKLYRIRFKLFKFRYLTCDSVKLQNHMPILTYDRFMVELYTDLKVYSFIHKSRKLVGEAFFLNWERGKLILVFWACNIKCIFHRMLYEKY